VYALVHVMCLCVYVSMVCHQCMLYDDMYLHNKVYEGRCFGHVMFKVCQCATNDDKVSKGIMQVSVKNAQSTS
jgi:hypothetical protein